MDCEDLGAWGIYAERLSAIRHTSPIAVLWIGDHTVLFARLCDDVVASKFLPLIGYVDPNPERVLLPTLGEDGLVAEDEY